MKYYLVTDVGTQWFTYLISIGEGGGFVECIDAANLPDGTLMKNIHSREPIDKWMELRHCGLILGGGAYGGWNISRAEFDRLKRIIELMPAVVEYNKLKDSF